MSGLACVLLTHSLESRSYPRYCGPRLYLSCVEESNVSFDSLSMSLSDNTHIYDNVIHITPTHSNNTYNIQTDASERKEERAVDTRLFVHPVETTREIRRMRRS